MARCVTGYDYRMLDNDIDVEPRYSYSDIVDETERNPKKDTMKENRR